MGGGGHGGGVVPEPPPTLNLGLGLSAGAVGELGLPLALLIGLRSGVRADDLGLECLQSVVQGRRLIGLEALATYLQLAGPDLALLLVERQGLNRDGCRKCSNWTLKLTCK